jgi:hypothetical protein
MQNAFAKGTRAKLRFQTVSGKPSGLLAIEDLWALSEDELKSMRRGYRAQLKAILGDQDEDSDVKPTREQTDLELRISIVSEILDTRKAESQERQNSNVKQAEVNKLDELIAKKQEASLEQLSLEELLAKKAALIGK